MKNAAFDSVMERIQSLKSPIKVFQGAEAL